MVNRFKKIRSHLVMLRYRMLRTNNDLIKSQRKNPLSIPVIIINFNQLFFLRQLVDFLLERKFTNIVIIDNNSDFKPLLEYYDEINGKVTVERRETNDGHLVFFGSRQLQEKYGKGYYFLTDADIIPNSNLPQNFAMKMIETLDKYFRNITKVGFALDIENLPDFYPPKQKVIEWEKEFWKQQVVPNLYKASVDTTFALYKPGYPQYFNSLHFLQGLRMAGNFTAKHGGWFINPKEYTEENLHYIRSVNKSSTWKLDEDGNHDSKGLAFSKNENNE